MNKKIIVIFLIALVVILIGIILIKTIPSKKVEEKVEKEKSSNVYKEDNMTIIENNNVNKEEIKNDDNYILLNVNDKVLRIKPENNSSSEAFIQKLKEGEIIVNADDYGNFEKVGDLGFSLPTNDERIVTKPGDLILYQGNQITLYYDTNTWNFTKLGEVENVTKEELKDILGNDSVKLVFSLDK